MTLIKLPKSAHMDKLIFGRSPAAEAVKDMRRANREVGRIMKRILKSGKAVKVRKKGKTRGRPSKWERQVGEALSRYILRPEVVQELRRAHEEAIIFGVGHYCLPLRPDFDESAKRAMDRHLAPRRHRMMTATEVLERQRKEIPKKDAKIAKTLRKVEKEVMKPLIKRTMTILKRLDR